MRIKFDANPKQQEFMEDVKSPILMYTSGLGGGKTYGLVNKSLQLSFLNKDTEGGFLCPSYSDYKRDVLPTFEKIFEENKLTVKINLSDKFFIFPWTNKKLYVFTGENPIKGPNLGWCCINEFSSIRWERIREMMERVRDKKAKYMQRVFAGTPEDVFGWVPDFVEAQQLAGRINLIKGTTMDNLAHLGEDYIDQLKTTLDPVALKLFLNGEMVRLGTDYFYYAYRPENNDNPDLRWDKDLLVHIGLDFNVSRMAAVCAHKVGDKLHVFDEIYLNGGNSDTNMMADALEARYPKHQVLITCDAAGKARKTSGLSDVDILRARGFEVRYRSANPRLRKRQLLMNGLLHNGRILIHPTNCKTLKRDLSKVEQHQATFEKVKTNPDMTHASDCLDYLCDFEFAFTFDRQNKVRTGYIGGTI